MAYPVSCAEEPIYAGHSWWMRLFSQTFQQVHQGECLYQQLQVQTHTCQVLKRRRGCQIDSWKTFRMGNRAELEFVRINVQQMDFMLPSHEETLMMKMGLVYTTLKVHLIMGRTSDPVLSQKKPS